MTTTCVQRSRPQSCQPYRYRITAMEQTLPDARRFVTYGLELTGRGHRLALPDISSRRPFVEHLAALFNRVQLSPVHMRDVVEDMLP